MSLTLTLTRDEFAARRRTLQTDVETALHKWVDRAVDLTQPTDGWRELLNEVEDQYGIVYASESGVPPIRYPRGWRNDLLDTLRKTTAPRTEATVERITRWLATNIISQATAQAAVDDPAELGIEWVTMHDTDVRPEHVQTDGQVRPIGEPFDVDGVEMAMPGDTRAPIELWINCRCTVRPVSLEEAFTMALAAEFVSEKPWDGSASRFTPEQYRSSCILHRCEGLEKSCHSLPIKEPGGALSRAAVHAAAGRLGSTDASPEQKAKAKAALRGAYKQLGEQPPDSLTASEEEAMFDVDEELAFPPKKKPDEDEAPPDFPPGETDGPPEFPPPGDETPPEDEDEDTKKKKPPPFAGIPWHGVLAPEGIASGDGRRFVDGSLSHRPLPLPLTWQKASDDGHRGNVTVAKIEQVEMADGLMKASGHFLDIPEADEVMGLLAEFGRFGVSVDADSTTFEVNEDEQCVDFTEARVSSACIVPIPAFAEAWVSLGEWDDDVPADLAASVEMVDTEDGPGWLTHPIPTDRLRDYWVRGPGAVKIGWGTAGDFNRCRMQVAKYVKPQHLNGYCANRHYDALGFWPGRPVSGETTPFAADELGLTDTDPAEAVTLAASGGFCAPSDWFADPGLDGPTPLTVTDKGRVFGHLATWGTCHIGFADQCVTPPRSGTAYAYFLTGEVTLDNDTTVPVGCISMGGGHAGPNGSARHAIAHYDSTSAAVCDVTMGEDDHGIWFAGWVRPGTDDTAVTALRASTLSGDWRKVGGSLELVAALAVNVPGFPVPRTRVAASAEGQLSLVAAGVVPPDPGVPGVVDLESLAEKVVEHLRAKDRRRERMATLAERYGDGL